MNYFKLKQYFVNQLLNVYDVREIEQIFFLVLEDLYQISKTDYILKKQELVDDDVILRFDKILSQLKANKPIQYILKYAYCFERKFKVNQNVLIPRQETESLIELIQKTHQSPKVNLLDIGTGTGCIPIILKIQNPEFQVSAIDISKEALKLAEKNAEQYSVEIKLFQKDILNPKQWLDFENSSFDIIVSNPPYVLNSEKIKMHNNVLDYEPKQALFVNDDNPLVFYTAII